MERVSGADRVVLPVRQRTDARPRHITDLVAA